MNWTLNISKKASKMILELPKNVQKSLIALLADIENNGPVRGNWANYSKLAPTRHHCHIKKGSPTYVAVWEETDKEIKLIEVTYAGTHEKAPY
ncbi:MAG: cytotoxic translational repressor of toxin-antitoxin stability system [Desulfamplus sp.]|nr:cytotoxic translational repressor of toxin-antitoxin stability system [Desulfamplus sp.]